MGYWAGGDFADAPEPVTDQRSARLVLVNPAYASQVSRRADRLEGERHGDRFITLRGEDLHADVNGSRNCEGGLTSPRSRGSWRTTRPGRFCLGVPSGRTLRVRKSGLDVVRAGQPGADKILRPESNRCLGTDSRHARPLHLRCRQYLRMSASGIRVEMRAASGAGDRNRPDFRTFSQSWSGLPVYVSHHKIYGRANSNSGPMSWLSAARRAAICLVRVSLTSVRFALPHVNGSWPRRAATESPIKRVV